MAVKKGVYLICCELPSGKLGRCKYTTNPDAGFIDHNMATAKRAKSTNGRCCLFEGFKKETELKGCVDWRKFSSAQKKEMTAMIKSVEKVARDAKKMTAEQMLIKYTKKPKK